MLGFPIRRHTLFPLIFFASGFAGLIYESIWTHYLKLFLGHAAYAQTLVLAIFMGGMAVGASLVSRWAARWSSPLRAYALTELAIGLLALVFHAVFVDSTEWLYRLAETGALSVSGFAVAKWLLATALIVPASILLGATFPLFTAALSRRTPGAEGFTIATLYFVNSLGGAVGVLASGFLAIPHLGLDGTIAMAGVCNVVIALIAWQLPGQRAAAREGPAQSPLVHDATTRRMLILAFCTGAASFIYEVGWIRMLSLVLGGATHSFELMLSAFILGLALGGWWIRHRIDRTENIGALLGKVQVIMGVCALATLPLYALTFEFIGWLVSNVPKTDFGYGLLNLGRYTVSAALMMPAAFCAGMTLPLATRLLFSHRQQGESAIGAVYSANTLGAIAGVVFAVHIGFSLLGLKYLVALGAFLDAGLGIWLLLIYARHQAPRFAGYAISGLVIGGLAIGFGFDPQHLVSGVYRTGQARSKNEVLTIADGKTASISVDREPSGALLIRTNGKPDASAVVDGGPVYKMDEITMALIAVIPLVLHEAPSRVANIGFGSGITGHTLLSDSRVQRVDTIEIEPKMAALARHFRPMNQRIYDDPRSHVHFDDAKSFFAANGQAYDLIISEPSNPWVSGVAGLFSVEFYRHVRRYLADDGLFVQWIQVYETHPDRMASVLKAMDGVFDDYAVFALDFGDVLLVAKKRGELTLPSQPFDRLTDETKGMLRRLEVLNNADLIYRMVGNKSLFSPWLSAKAIPANSDFEPYLDRHADRDRFVGALWPASTFDEELSPFYVQELIGGRPPLPAKSAITANNHFGNEPLALTAQLALASLRGEEASSRLPRFSPKAWGSGDALIKDCQSPPMGDSSYVQVRIATTVLPYLSREEGNELLQGFAGFACMRGDRADGAWRLLLQQLANRDNDFAATATHLLSTGEGKTESRARFLLGLALTGNLAKGNAMEAGALWQRYGEALAPSPKRGLALQMLVARLPRRSSSAAQ